MPRMSDLMLNDLNPQSLLDAILQPNQPLQESNSEPQMQELT